MPAVSNGVRRMERIIFNRWVMLGACLLMLGIVYASVTEGFVYASRSTDAGQAERRQANEQREAEADELAKWQDESELIDKTGEQAPAALAQPAGPAPAKVPQPAGDDGEPAEVEAE